MTLEEFATRLRSWLRPMWTETAERPAPHISTIALLVYALLVVLRAPILMTRPRFWAEEGAIYFLAASTEPWYVALFAPHLGYYSFFPNFATLIATLVPLQHAPSVTLIFSLLAHLIPAMVVMTSRATVFSNLGVRFATFAAFVFVPAAAGEIWLNTINAQVFLTAACFLLLIEPDAPPRRTTVMTALLLIIGLSAPAANFLLPFFVLRSLVTKSKSSWIMCGVLAFTLLVQIVAHLVDPADRTGTTVAIWLQSWLSRNVADAVLYRYPGPAWLVGTGILVCLMLLVLRSFRAPAPAPVVSLAVFVWLSLIGSWFSLGGTSGARYAFAPTIALVVGLASVASRMAEQHKVRIAAAAVIGVILAGGVLNYLRPDSAFSPSYPVWAEEVRRYRSGETDELLIWPQWEWGSWAVQLPR